MTDVTPQDPADDEIEDADPADIDNIADDDQIPPSEEEISQDPDYVDED